MSKEIPVPGSFDRVTLAELYRKTNLQVGDVLISRKDERFTISKIFEVEQILPNGSRFSGGMAFDMVGSKKGKVFTVHVR